MTMTQTQLARELIAALNAVSDRATEIDETLDAAAVDWQPAPDAWSVAQVFEHLCVANDSYIKVIRPLVERAGGDTARGGSSAEWRPSLIGRVLAQSMTSPRKLPAPKRWRPAPTPLGRLVPGE